MKAVEFIEVRIDKLVHGGQGLGALDDGRKVFVWNALPGERVRARVVKRKKSFTEALAEEILEPSAVGFKRLEPREPYWLATSPWQIMTLTAENEAKAQIVRDLYARVSLPDGSSVPIDLPEFSILSTSPEWNYRNKMEYSFYGDENGLHLAHYVRGSHHKMIVPGSALALPAIDTACNDLVAQLSGLGVRAGSLKTVIARTEQPAAAARTVLALYVKDKDFPELKLQGSFSGLVVYYSDPRSPASVPTKKLYEYGSLDLGDEILGKNLAYNVQSFFQVNVPVFADALEDIRQAVADAPKVVDMYSGVGSIGLNLSTKDLTLVELDPASVAMAQRNAITFAGQRGDQPAKVVHASSEQALEFISTDVCVVVDPPRAGLHPKVVARLLETRPPKIVYLSCDPATQARDIAQLLPAYSLESFSGYNFFPHTPHIETLAVLHAK